jgi:glycogen synthase
MPENPEVTEGGSVELTAVGYDAAKNQIAVSPTWSLVSGSYAGKLDAPQKSGNKAMFNGIRAGKVVIQVVQNGIKAQITVTVQKMTAVQAKGMK